MAPVLPLMPPWAPLAVLSVSSSEQAAVVASVTAAKATMVVLKNCIVGLLELWGAPRSVQTFVRIGRRAGPVPGM
ncbi:MAG: hypothetical protein AAF928_15410 [Myxococcota bacterium]